ncbi:NADH dehydrogenase [ubiquinone] 1 beta subcomplex subunit 9 [Glycine soja]|uniref:NADH dehydrogenase [ubiquinone] 1 beta subcomplex subunit 9 n=1 Tax=Glycine soja TaxID=3848 RepID=A0A445K328_GLYSO|nr:NADH dehydrogenase [ubiquinone] 1 beta subcomplex subunit 9 [Glycine soja]
MRKGPMLGRSGPNLIRRRAGFDLEVVCLCHFSSNPWLNLRLGSELKKHKVWLRRQRTLLGARRRRRGFGSSTAAPSKTLSTGPYIATSSTTTLQTSAKGSRRTDTWFVSLFLLTFQIIASEDPDTIDRLITDAEASYNKWRHPDPYIVPWAPGGSKFTRNPTPPQG